MDVRPRGRESPPSTRQDGADIDLPGQANGDAGRFGEEFGVFIRHSKLETIQQEEQMIDKETMSHPRFMTVAEAAELLHLAPESLYALVSERRIPYRKAGRRLLFLESELIEWTRPIERKRRFSSE